MDIAAALLFSLLAPGSGQAYNGQKAKALIFGSIYALSYLITYALLAGAVIAVPRGPTYWARMICSGAYVGFCLWAVADAVWQRINIRRGKRRAGSGGWKMALLALALILAGRILIMGWVRGRLLSVIMAQTAAAKAAAGR